MNSIIGSAKPSSSRQSVGARSSCVTVFAVMPWKTETMSRIPNSIQASTAATGTTHTSIRRRMRSSARSRPCGCQAARACGVPWLGGRCRRSCARTCRAAARRCSESRLYRAMPSRAAAVGTPNNVEARRVPRTHIQVSCSARTASPTEDSGPADRDGQCGPRPVSASSTATATVANIGIMRRLVARSATARWNAASERNRRGSSAATARAADGSIASDRPTPRSGTSSTDSHRPVVLKPRPVITAPNMPGLVREARLARNHIAGEAPTTYSHSSTSQPVPRARPGAQKRRSIRRRRARRESIMISAGGTRFGSSWGRRGGGGRWRSGGSALSCGVVIAVPHPLS